jgi:hypothetical protein
VAQRSSATSPSSVLGREFADALSRQDFQQLVELLDPGVDFRALTPRRAWEATSSGETLQTLQTWFPSSRTIDETIMLETDAFADCQRVAYRFRGHVADEPFVIEQQAYFRERDGRIDWLRVMCSGFRTP